MLFTNHYSDKFVIYEMHMGSLKFHCVNDPPITVSYLDLSSASEYEVPETYHLPWDCSRDHAYALARQTK
jgi:hypothetical protein